MLLPVSKDLIFSAPEIEARGYICPEELDYLPSDLNTKIVRTLQSHSLQTAYLPERLLSLKFIHVVDLSGTQIRGEDLQYLPPRIRELSIQDCEEIEWLPPSLKGLELLSTLNASQTYIRNESLNNLPISLKVLKIESCPLISRLPQGVGSLKNLEAIYLANSAVDYLENLPFSIEKIDARNCPINTLGSTLTSCARLREIHLSHRHFEVDELRYLACYIDPAFIQLQLITIDRESAIAYYQRFNYRTFLKEGFSEKKCIELIKKNTPRLKNATLQIIS